MQMQTFYTLTHMQIFNTQTHRITNHTPLGSQRQAHTHLVHILNGYKNWSRRKNRGREGELERGRRKERVGRVGWDTVTHACIHTHACTHAHKAKKAKCLATTRITRTWQSQDNCALSRYCVPVLRNRLEPGKELAGAPTVPLTAGVGTRSPTNAFSDQWDTASVLCSPVQDQVPILQMGGLEYLWCVFSSCSGIRTSVLWVVIPRLYQLNHQGTHTHARTHTHAHARTHTHTHTVELSQGRTYH